MRVSAPTARGSFRTLAFTDTEYVPVTNGHHGDPHRQAMLCYDVVQVANMPLHGLELI